MKRILIAVLSAAALLLFWADAASAYAVAKAAGPSIDPPNLDYTTVNPLDIPGITIVEPTNDTLDVFIGRNQKVYFREGIYKVLNFTAKAGAEVYGGHGSAMALLTGGKFVSGEDGQKLVQFIGAGWEYGSVGLFVQGGNVEITNTIFIGHMLGIQLFFINPHAVSDSSLDAISRLDDISANISIKNSYFTRHEKAILGFDALPPFFRDMVPTSSAPRNISIDSCVFFGKWFGSSSDVSIYLVDAYTNLQMMNTSFEDGFEGNTPNTMFVRALRPDLENPEQYREISKLLFADFLDCTFGPNHARFPWSGVKVPEYREFVMEDNPNITYRETRVNRIIQTHPRLLPLLVTDVDGDDEVGYLDAWIVATNIGTNVGDTPFTKYYDLDSSGGVTTQDLGIVTREWLERELGLPSDFKLADLAQDTNLLDPVKPQIRELFSGLDDGILQQVAADPEFGPLMEAVFPPTAILDETAGVPSKFALEQNYPNPFNASTVIPFALAEDGEVLLVVRNLAGQVVRTLAQGYLPVGIYSKVWDGKDQNGVDVSSGMYLFDLAAGSERAVRKIMLLR